MVLFLTLQDPVRSERRKTLFHVLLGYMTSPCLQAPMAQMSIGEELLLSKSQHTCPNALHLREPTCSPLHALLRQLLKEPTVPLLSKHPADMPEAGVLYLQVYTPDALQGLQQPGGRQTPLSDLKGREAFHSINPTLLMRLTTAPSLSQQEEGGGLRGFCLFVYPRACFDISW